MERSKNQELWKHHKKLMEIGKQQSEPVTVASYLTGEKYFQAESPRLLVIGRALNGWLPDFCELAHWETQNTLGVPFKSRFIRNAATHNYEKATAEDCRGLSWINTYLKKGKRHQKTASTPFWQAAREAVALLHGSDHAQSENFYQYMAWTNLCKVSPENGGNPTGALWYDQLAACNEMLKQEVAILAPTHILVIAKANTSDPVRENEWIEPFKATLDGFSAQGIRVVCIHRHEYQSKEKIREEIRALRP